MKTAMRIDSCYYVKELLNKRYIGHQALQNCSLDIKLPSSNLLAKMCFFANVRIKWVIHRYH